MAISDLEVDQIIEKVMIRNESKPYDYARRGDGNLTTNEHIWHFHLQ